MKLWWNSFIKDYLTFSKKERRGILVLLTLSIAVYIIFRILPVRRNHVDKSAFQKELAQLSISVDSSPRANYAYNNATENHRTEYEKFTKTNAETFPFDPNTLDAAGWKRLGLRDKTINTIHNFIAKGYRFRQAEDLRKIYGLSSRDADRLVPFVRIALKEPFSKKSAENPNYTTFTKTAADKYKPAIIDINQADTSAFISLPGIGSKLAARIINFRTKLGGFTSVNQLGETYGIPDTVFQKIKVRLNCNNLMVKKLNINTADANELKSHPYIRWNIANAIVNYRSQHGPFKSIADVRKIEIIPDDLFNKIAPYLVL